MKKTIICSIPMKERVDSTVYSSNDKSLPVSERAFRFPINSFLSQTSSEGDEYKAILLIKKDSNLYYERNTEFFKEELNTICDSTGAKVEYFILDTDFAQKREIHEQLMGKIVEEIEEGSSILADITYGPKDIPIVIFSALSFAEKFLECEIVNIVYGRAEYKNDRVISTEICDIRPFENAGGDRQPLRIPGYGG